MEVLCDYRLGNNPRYYLGEKGDSLMLVPDEVRKCVVFICYKGDTGVKLGGTAFFVGVPGENPDIIYPYLVTARHVIEGVKKKSIDGTVGIRINRKNQSVQVVNTNLNDWRFHPTDDTVDVAAIQIAPSTEVYDFLYIPSSMAATEEVIVKEKIGCGDEVFLTGLFISHYGAEKNVPIIRIGNIACMPEELVQSKELGATEAYLVEARSIGGLSGSPVFVHLSGIRGGKLNLGVE
ncbi:hypothetical protein ACFLTL_02570, partial [Chloroflexota bacterium]